MPKKLTAWLILLGGLYTAGVALWHLGSTAIFVHEAVYIPGVVVDSTMRPFDGALEKLRHGNLPWDGDTAYRPHVRYTLFGLPRTDSTLPDLDNCEYADNAEVEIILHPQETTRRHINKFKFLWGGDLVLLGGGALVTAVAWRFIRRKRRRVAPRQAARQTTPQVPKPEPTDPQPIPEKKPSAPKKRQRKAPSSASPKKKADSEKKPKSATPRKRKKTEA